MVFETRDLLIMVWISVHKADLRMNSPCIDEMIPLVLDTSDRQFVSHSFAKSEWRSTSVERKYKANGKLRSV